MNNKYIFGALAVGLIVVAVVLGFLLTQSSDESDTADTTDDTTQQPAVAGDEFDVYFQWCTTTLPTAVQEVVVGVVGETQTVAEATATTEALFAAVSPPEELVTLHNANAEFLALILPGYIGANERAETGNEDFETLIFNALDADRQTRVRELVNEVASVYEGLPDSIKERAQQAGCSLYDDPFAGTTS